MRQITGCKKVHSYAQQVFESDLESAQIKECGARKGINQKIRVTVLVVSSVHDRPKDTRISGSVFLD